MILNGILYLVALVALWTGAGLIIKSVDIYSSRLKISRFAVSFFILGILTSIPELSVGINAIAEKDPEIFVGNLLGGVIILFLFVIPVLAIFGNGIRSAKELDMRHLILALIVIAAPSFFIADKSISNFDGAFMIILYLLLLFFIQRKKGLVQAIEDSVEHPSTGYAIPIISTVTGMFVVATSSHIIVNETMIFSRFFHVTPFYLSLIGLSLGTNLPELSLAVRSVLSRKTDIALGDYIGSAAANTLLFGILTIAYPTVVNINGNFIITFCFIAAGLTLFYFFSRSGKRITQLEGSVLLLLYILFLVIELT